MPATASPTFRHVCCCVDDITQAGPAIAEAQRLCHDSGRLTVLHVAPPEPVMTSAMSEWGEVDPDDPLATPRAWLSETVTSAGAGDPVVVTGDPAGEVACRWARENGVDLMVSSARGGGLRQRVLGSFAGRLAEDAPCPVLLLAAVEDPTPPPAEPVGPYAHVAAITDGSAESLRALDATERIGGGGDTRMSVVVVRGTWQRITEAVTGGGDEAAREDIDRRSRDLTGGPATELSGRPGATLEEWARDTRPDLLVVAEDGPLGPALRRSAGGLASEGACSLMVALASRPAPGGGS
jgi:nucleotide-binding universal stress UspA family protein